MNRTRACKGFDLFVAIKKGRIGLPKSSTLVESIRTLALQNNACSAYFEHFSQAANQDEEILKKQAARADIAAYLRGCKCVLFETFKSLRKIFYAMAGPNGVESLDRLSQQYPLITSTKDNLFHVFFSQVDDHVSVAIEKAVESQVLIPLLQQFIKAGGTAATSVNFVTQLSLADVPFAQADNQQAADVLENETDILSSLEESENKALQRFHRNHEGAGQWSKLLAARAMCIDATRKGPSMRTATAKAERIYRQMVQQGCVQEMSLFLDGSPKNQKRKCLSEEKEHKTLQLEIDAFFQGAYETAEALQMALAAALETYLQFPSHKTKDILSQGSGDFLSLGELVKSGITDIFLESIRSSTNIFLHDMRNEGLVSETQNALSVELQPDDKILVRCTTVLRRGQQGLRGIAFIVHAYPDMIKVVSHWPSVCEPLALLLKEEHVNETDRPALAKATADLVQMDFSLKNALVHSGALRKFLATHYTFPNFIQVMSGFTGASLQIKKKRHSKSAIA